MKLFHNALLSDFRSPSGAVELSTKVLLKVAVAKEVEVKRVVFCYHVANEWDTVYEENMEFDTQTEEYNYYKIFVTFDTIKTIYYYFRLEYLEYGRIQFVYAEKIGDINSKYFDQSYESHANNRNNISKWELTFYDKANFANLGSVPGIYYQIFPDRFFRSKNYQYERENGSREMIIHENFFEYPVYLPDAQGIVRNNDYFLGNLEGIIEKLDYLQELHVTYIYLNPIFLSKSNHGYDALDYLRINPTLGLEEHFYRLCKEAHKRGIKVLLDFVPNHVSSESKYAMYSRGTHWWGIQDLVEIQLCSKEVQDFFFNQVLEKWLNDKQGTLDRADGIRCDVADEYPLDFIYKLYQKVKSFGKDKLIIFEVWEHASAKFANGALRNYLQGNMCDSVMNYELKDAMLELVCNKNSVRFVNVCKSQLQTYPRESRNALMNVADTHDSIRIITALGNKPYVQKGDFRDSRILAEDRTWQYENHRMPQDKYEKAKRKLKLFLVLQFTLHGNPSIYYGSEVGLEGYLDPSNRRSHPFEKGDMELLHFFKEIATLREQATFLNQADLNFLEVDDDGFVVYEQRYQNERLVVAINVSYHTKEVKHCDSEPLLLVNLEEYQGTLLPNTAVIFKE